MKINQVITELFNPDRRANKDVFRNCFSNSPEEIVVWNRFVTKETSLERGKNDFICVVEGRVYSVFL